MYHYVKSAGIFLTALFSFSLTIFADGNAQNKNDLLQNQAADNIVKVWIYFKDKGAQDELQLNKAKQLISERAVKRRLKVKKVDKLYDFYDLPVCEHYIKSIEPYIKKIRVRSRWINAVSVEIKQGNFNLLRKFDFIKKIEPVICSHKDEPIDEKSTNKKPDNSNSTKSYELDYGESETQLALINVPDLHEKGLFGQGVLICLLDDGFNMLNQHITFDSLDIIDTWDFINNDPSVDDNNYSGEGTHGTKTLSSIAGYTPGSLIGPAFKASYLLAKTEVDSSETPIEEDYWVAGIEWAESKGADITSSSLGYDGWYTYQDMDGETAVTTIAADIAADKGVLVVNSAGNEGYNSEHNTLIAPADGKKVLAIGAVSSNGERCSFSSVGPSYDGRIKPDLAAMGSGVVAASPYNSTGFINSSGTSFSCPLTAGAAALIISAYPDSTPEQIREALRKTASQADNPDNLLGWGIVDAQAAYNYLSASNIHNDYFNPYIPLQPIIAQNHPNPFNETTTIIYILPNACRVQITIYDVNGRKVKKLVDAARQSPNEYTLEFNACSLATGIYYCLLTAKDLSNNKIYRKAKKMILLK